MATPRRLLLVVCTLLLVGTALYLSINYELEREHRRTRQAITLRYVGMIALAYLKDHGCAPESTQDLFAQGYIAPHDRYAELIAIRRAPGGIFEADYLDKVVFSFPANSLGFTIGSGGLLRGPDGQKHLILDLQADDRSESAVVSVNRLYAEPWLKLMRGEPSGIGWVDMWPSTQNAE